MSAVETPPDHEARVTEECPRCGSALRPGQDWCLNCGNAVSTTIAGSKGWRAPLAIVGAVLAVAVVALVVAFLEISDDAEQIANAPDPAPTSVATAQPGATPTPSPTPFASPTVTPTPEVAPDDEGAVPAIPGIPTPGSDTEDPAASPTTTPDPAASTGTVGSWPEGEEAWTVVLLSAESKSEAEERAEELAGQGVEVGVLRSDDYSSLRAGYWVVFSGQYDSQEDAQKAAEDLGAQAAAAYARFVKE